MTLLGCILFALGFLAMLYGEVRFLVAAYRRNLLWFLGCLFIPPAGLVFFLLNARETWRPVMLNIIGFLIAGFGYWLGGFEFL